MGFLTILSTNENKEEVFTEMLAEILQEKFDKVLC